MEQKANRILTVFIYLNDVEQGGSTAFPDLDITVTPKRGRVLIWPSVLNDYPQTINWGTEHEAQVVEKGLKFAANVWFHLKPLKLAWTNYKCCEKRRAYVENRPTLGEGDLGDMFERIVENPVYTARYDTTVLSSPETNGPWIVTLQNFITPEEATALIELGAERGYENSTLGVEGYRDDSGRSSSQTWCDDECEENEVAQAVLQRIYDLTHIPQTYSEHMQLLKYEAGEL